jgi:FixJ family two-component response regulator
MEYPVVAAGLVPIKDYIGSQGIQTFGSSPKGFLAELEKLTGNVGAGIMTLFDVVQTDEIVEAVLVVGDEIDWIDECQFMLQSFGLPSFAAQSPADAFAKIGNRSISTLIINQNLHGLDGISLAEELAARTASEGRELRFILVAEHANLDMVAAAARASVIDILPKPITRDNLRNALLRVRGVEPEGSTRKALASQLTTLSLEIQRLSSLMDGALPSFGKAPPAAVEAAASDEALTAEFIRDLLRKESRRRSLLNGRLFGDCTWSVLLDLLAAKLDGCDVSVSSACIASGAPTTTALRLINRLVSEDILLRIPDAHDRRRDFLRLSPDVEAPLLAYLADLRKN